METLLRSEKLNKSYFTGKNIEHHVLRDVNLEINRGEFISVMGPSGSGKSTLLYNISGMDRMTSGSVVFNGHNLSDMSEKQLSRLRLNNMGFIFQQIHLLKNLSLFDNIIMTAYLAGRYSRRAVNEKAAALMEKTGIAQLADNDSTRASGGELQRAGICRALINDPDIIFGDEPTGALNSKASDEIMELLAEINSSGTTVMLVTHDVKVAAVTDRVLFMSDGSIVSEKKLGRFSEESGSRRSREEILSGWLLNLGF